MSSVNEAFALFESFCLECLVTKTGHRSNEVIHELDGLGAGDPTYGRCASCTESGPVFHLPTLLRGRAPRVGVVGDPPTEHRDVAGSTARFPPIAKVTGG